VVYGNDLMGFSFRLGESEKPITEENGMRNTGMFTCSPVDSKLPSYGKKGG
jgi:hypothetical protein